MAQFYGTWLYTRVIWKIVEGGGSGTFIIQITVPSFLISSFCELVTLVNIWNKLAIVHRDSYDII